jgi:4-hydroxy-3-methylbut-2-enyl diphosphate reductase
LLGQTLGEAIVVNSETDLDKIDFTKPVRFYSQTTQPVMGFKNMVKGIEERYRLKGIDKPDFIPYNTICTQVSHKEPSLKKFAKEHDVVLFVSGKKSSNGLFLYELCKSINSKTYFISDKNEIHKDWFINAASVGVCGATSTPMWLMEDIADIVNTF